MLTYFLQNFEQIVNQEHRYQLVFLVVENQVGQVIDERDVHRLGDQVEVVVDEYVLQQAYHGARAVVQVKLAVFDLGHDVVLELELLALELLHELDLHPLLGNLVVS